jgi:hypothetical protein
VVRFVFGFCVAVWLGNLNCTGQVKKVPHPGLWILPFDQELFDSIPNFENAVAAVDLSVNPSLTQRLLDGTWIVSTGEGANACLITVPVTLKGISNKPGVTPGAKKITRWNDLINPDHDFLDAETRLIRLHDGSLLAMKQGITWRNLPQKPDWWNTPGLESAAGTMPGQRGCLFFFYSKDDGKVWKPVGMFDNAEQLDGEFARPRNGYIGAQVFPGKFNPSVMRNIRVTYEPFLGVIYLSMDCIAGLGIDNGNGTSLITERRENVVVGSDDLGFSWEVIHRTQLPAGPIHTVTTKELQMYAVYFNGKDIVAKVSKPEQNKLGEEQVIVKAGKFGQDNYAHLPANLALTQLSLSRVYTPGGVDHVRVAVPFLNPHGKQGYCVYLLTPDEKDSVTLHTSLIEVIQSDKPGEYSCVGGTFSDVDFCNYNTNSSTSLFFWMETTGNDLSISGSVHVNSSHVFSARGCLFTGAHDFTDPFYLSLENGKPRHWYTVDPEDYKMSMPLLVTTFYTGDTVGFLAAWREEGDMIKYNVVIPKKPGANLKPDEEWNRASSGMSKIGLGMKGMPYLSLGMAMGKSTQAWLPSPGSSFGSDFTPWQSPISFVEFGYSMRNGFSIETGFRFQRTRFAEVYFSDSVNTYRATDVNQENYFSIPFKLKYTFNRTRSLWISPFADLRLNFTSGEATFHDDYFDRVNTNYSVSVNYERPGAANMQLTSDVGLEISHRVLKRFSLNGYFAWHLNQGAMFQSRIAVESESVTAVAENKLEQYSYGISLRHYFLQQNVKWKPAASAKVKSKARNLSKPPKGFRQLGG